MGRTTDRGLTIPSPALFLVAAAAVIVAALFLAWALAVRRMPDLQPWHLIRLQSDFHVTSSGHATELKSYLETEDAVFNEVEEALAAHWTPDSASPLCRYEPNGRNNPTTFPVNWNRTFELRPSEVKGGILLLHGLTDSPYTLRRIGQVLHDQGFYVLGLRLPGHGTLPSAIGQSTRKDWIAATRIGAAHVGSQLTVKQPFWIVGYSNGGTLALDYSLQMLDEGADSQLRLPQRLVLVSPALGVTRAAAFAQWHRPLSLLPPFAKLAWHTIYPEHDPFKYNSFPNSAGYQTHRLISEVSDALDRCVRNHRMSDLPPVLTFQSLADATVLTEAVIEDLYLKLAGNSNELVVFDLNRVAYMADFFAADPAELLAHLHRQPEIDFRLTVITNADQKSRAVAARSRPPGGGRESSRPLGLEWPLEVYSMSHVSLPFAPDDPIYGQAPDALPQWGVPLGSVEPRGERRLLKVPIELFMRLRHNPFFPYIEERLVALAEHDLRSNSDV